MAKRLKPLSRYRIDGRFRMHIDKIMNSYYFRKLAGKTQVILSLSGPSVRTRLTHTVEVARIAREICEDLGLNAELAEVIALAHDIGHTPFGHVGERTLREIMCGCDTLDGKTSDIDFANSGFKHNLQSFRVLMNLEVMSNDMHKDKWPYILWGVPNHSKMTYSKSYSGMEEEIYVSCKHCDAVFRCYYHEKKECKRNIQKKKDIPNKAKTTAKEICKPWYCAMLEEIQDKKDIDPNDLHGLTREEYVKEGFIKKQQVDDIFCKQKCYMAKLWGFKINNRASFEHFNYLYDHPFPNSFYAHFLADYFNLDEDIDCISIEGLIVSQADEIAQRQQDLEDGINKGLISFKDARAQVEEMVKPFNEDNKLSDIVDKVEHSKNQKDLGEAIVMFYKDLLGTATKGNFESFISKPPSAKKEPISIYCVMNILYAMHKNEKEKRNWLYQELRNLIASKGKSAATGSTFLDTYFVINVEPAYFYLLLYDYLDKSAKLNIYVNDILTLLAKHLKLTYHCNTMNSKAATLPRNNYLIMLDEIRDCLKTNFPDEYDDFILRKEKRNNWKNIGHLNLFHISVLSSVYASLLKNRGSSLLIKDLQAAKLTLTKEFKPSKAFVQWRGLLGGEASRVLANVVSYVRDNDPEKKGKMKALKKFEDLQKNGILKSEIVEKNDGKASYILKRLFKAYISNSHRLSDIGLKLVLIILTDNVAWDDFISDEERTYREIVNKLWKTMIIKNGNKKAELERATFMDITDADYDGLRRHTSNEILALLEERRNLYEFLKLFKTHKTKIRNSLRNDDGDSKTIKEVLIHFRRVMDNPILNAMQFWKSILTRGICDYIASLTDQEAIDEYEKLYAGVMELV